MKDCEKKSFETRKKANNRAKEILNKTGKKLYSYKCNICDKYHLTSTSKKEYKYKRVFLRTEAEYHLTKMGLTDLID